MSNPAALATVTATLHYLLSNVAASVTTQPPSTARSGTGEQINIFLYGIHYNTAFSNASMPGETRNGEHAPPPLPLVLKYLITAYGAGDDDISGQQLMGQAMSILHDHPLLGPSDIHGITPESNLQNQVEHIRITPDTLSLDDMSKLWASFQSAEYRLSTGYEVSVVLIESTRPAKTPLPVLERDISVQPDLIPPYPAITGIEFPNQQTSALLGDTLNIKGHHLDGDTISVRFIHPDLPDPIDVPVPPANGTDNQVSVQIPNNPVDWPAGFYTIEIAIIKAGEQDRITNILPLPLSPGIVGIAPPNPILRDGSGNATLTLTCNPQARPGQRAALLLGDSEVLAEDHIIQTDTLVFIVEDAPVGSRHIRLRIDGIDSLLVDHNVSPPAFDSAMEVTIT